MRVQLGEIADVQIGYQMTGRAEPDPEGTHLLVQTADLTDSRNVAWDRLSVIAPRRRDVGRQELLDGDVLFLAKGSRRVAVVVRQPPSRCMAVSTIYIIRAREQSVLLPEYLAWFLNVAARDELSARELQGTTMSYVRKESLLDLPLDVPSLARQYAIADLDNLLRRERALTSQLLDSRERLVNTIARRAVAGKDSLA